MRGSTVCILCPIPAKDALLIFAFLDVEATPDILLDTDRASANGPSSRLVRGAGSIQPLVKVYHGPWLSSILAAYSWHIRDNRQCNLDLFLRLERGQMLSLAKGTGRLDLMPRESPRRCQDIIAGRHN